MGSGSAAEERRCSRAGARAGTPRRSCVCVCPGRGSRGPSVHLWAAAPAGPWDGPELVPLPSPSWLCAHVYTHTHTHTHTLCWDCACHLVDSVGKGIPFSLPSQSVAPSPGHMWSLGPWGRCLGRGTQRAWGSVVLQVSSRSARPLLGVGSDGGRQG